MSALGLDSRVSCHTTMSKSIRPASHTCGRLANLIESGGPTRDLVEIFEIVEGLLCEGCVIFPAKPQLRAGWRRTFHCYKHHIWRCDLGLMGRVSHK